MQHKHATKHLLLSFTDDKDIMVNKWCPKLHFLINDFFNSNDNDAVFFWMSNSMRGQRVNLGSSLTVPLLSSLHTVNQHSYRSLPPACHIDSVTLVLCWPAAHTYSHTHTRVFCIEQSSREETNHCSFYSISFHLCEQLTSDVIFANVWMCFTVCPAIIFVPLSDSQKKGRERAQRNKTSRE